MLYLGVSFADATLYGNIDQTYNTSKVTPSNTSIATITGQTASQKTNFSAYQMGQSYLGVKGEEDLGGGMKANYLYEFGLATEATAAPSNRQSFVGLSGGFGAFRIGKQYSQAFLNTVAADPAGATGGAGAMYMAPETGYANASAGLTEGPLRQDRAIQYDLPNFVPGLNIGVTKVLGNANSANGGVKKGDGTGINIGYSFGGLHAGFTTDSVTGGDIYLGSKKIVDNTTTAKNKFTTLALVYDLGVAKPSYSNVKMSVGSESVQADMFAISVPVGSSAAVFVSSSSGKVDLAAAAGDMKAKGMQYGVNHSLSKRTVAYWHAGNSTLTQKTTGDSVKSTGYAIGMHHSF